MILVDIGNTSVHFGIERDGVIVENFRVYKNSLTNKKLKTILTRYSRQDIILCSVAPSVLKRFRGVARKVYIVGRDIKVPINNYYSKKDIGQDRLVNALAAKNLYPKGKIIIDFGTAITIDILSKRGDYLGGFILPGINLYLNSLSRCELLPDKVHIKKQHSFIPKNTKDSISAGLNESFPLMIDGFVRKYKRKLQNMQHSTVNVVITGGESSIISDKLKFPFIYDPVLTLKGLMLLKNRITNKS